MPPHAGRHFDAGREHQPGRHRRHARQRLLHQRQLASIRLERFRGSPFSPPVSIIAPAHNEGQSIGQSVRSFLSLDYPAIEVIVVNDGSTDAALLKAIDDAVADGMDVINLSLGTLEAPVIADDVIVHCRTEWQAKAIRKAIAKRLLDCGLELHPEKTRIIYCKDDLRKGRHTDEKFDFLGYEFRPRKSINRNGKVFANFSPAVSTKAAKSMRAIIRNWRLRQCSHQSLEDLSRLYNPILRGWFQYYGRYYRTGLYSVIRQLDQELVNWARQKYKKLRNHVRRARRWVAAVSRRSPHLFAPWATMRGGSLMGAV